MRPLVGGSGTSSVAPAKKIATTRSRVVDLTILSDDAQMQGVVPKPRKSFDTRSSMDRARVDFNVPAHRPGRQVSSTSISAAVSSGRITTCGY